MIWRAQHDKNPTRVDTTYAPPAQTTRQTEELETLIGNCIKNNDLSLYDDILCYKEVDFEKVMGVLKAQGIKCRKSFVAEYLDKQGVSYVNRISKKKATKTNTSSTTTK